ncbi:MAG: hypothetical protein AAFR63_02970 [Cyanobacteria bacterium J06631_6]
MAQSHFPNKILALPQFKGRFEANRLTTDQVDVYFASYSKGAEIEPH